MAGVVILSDSEAIFARKAGFGAGKIIMAARQTHFAVGHFTDQTVAHDFRCLVKRGLGALPRAGLPDEIVLLDGAHNGLLLGDRLGQGFFAINILPAPGCLGGHQLMPVVRYRDHHRVDVIAREHLLVIVVRLAILVSIVIVDRIDCGLQVVRVQIARGHHLAILLRQECLGITRTLHAPADDSQSDLAGGRGASAAPRGATGQDRWQDNGGRRGLQELAAVETLGLV